jgi:hypothetical protein
LSFLFNLFICSGRFQLQFLGITLWSGMGFKLTSRGCDWPDGEVIARCDF